MPREIKTKRIGNFNYRCKMLADPAGMKLLMRLMKTLFPTIGAGLKGLPEDGPKGGLADLTTNAIGDALIALSDSVSEEDMEFICDTLGSETQFTADNQQWFPLTSDETHWSGRYLEKFQWIVFGLEVNYADFLGGSNSLARIAGMFAAVQKSKSPSTSTGEPKESSQAPGTT